MFVYYNANPKGENIGDCVIRAISLALNLDYYKVIDLLYKTSDYFNCDMLVRDCYGSFLDNHFPKVIPNAPKTVDEIAKDFEYNTLLIRIEGHLTCAMNSDIYDTWDTRDELVDMFWIIN